MFLSVESGSSLRPSKIRIRLFASIQFISTAGHLPCCRSRAPFPSPSGPLHRTACKCSTAVGLMLYLQPLTRAGKEHSMVSHDISHHCMHSYLISSGHDALPAVYDIPLPYCLLYGLHSSQSRAAGASFF